MFCTKCGEKLVETAAFCHACGEKVNIVETHAVFSPPKKLPDPSFGAKPVAKNTSIEPKTVARESLIPEFEPNAAQTIAAKETEIETVHLPEPESEYEYTDSGEIGDIVIKMLKDDSEDAILLEPLAADTHEEPPKSDKKIWPVIVIGLIIVLMIFGILTVALPQVKPFKNIRELLGLSAVSETLPETATDAPETTTVTETEISLELSTAEYGAKLKTPAAPNLMSAGKVCIEISVYESFGKEAADISFSADFTNENQTVFYIPSVGDKPDMIFTVNRSNKTYCAYTGAYGRFYSEAEDEDLSDAPEELLLCIDILDFSFNKDYDGEYEAAGAQELEKTGIAHIYKLDNESLVWIDAASGVYVKAEQDGELLFEVNTVQTGDEVAIPDFENNMIEE